MEAVVYIIKSNRTGNYYIGETDKLVERIARHNNRDLNTNSTKTGIPWELFFMIKCGARDKARKIERHIKRMKSRKYIKNLLKYPEMVDKLLMKYD